MNDSTKSIPKGTAAGSPKSNGCCGGADAGREHGTSAVTSHGRHGTGSDTDASSCCGSGTQKPDAAAESRTAAVKKTRDGAPGAKRSSCCAGD